MRLRQQESDKARIEIIPMIDIIFFLLVFFMISTLSMTINRGLPVNLPKAASAPQELRESVNITVTREGEIFLNKEPIALQDVVQRVQAGVEKDPELLAVINADDQALHGTIVEVMDKVRLAGVSRLAIAVKPERRGKP
jgi:biopolymer transport protein ExbD